MVLLGLFLIFAIKDVIQVPKQTSKTQRAINVLKIVKTELKSDPVFFLVILGMSAAKVNFICNMQFGTIFVTDIYSSHSKSKQDARDYLGWLSLAANLLSVLFIGLFGYLSDKFQMWKVMIFVNISILVF